MNKCEYCGCTELTDKELEDLKMLNDEPYPCKGCGEPATLYIGQYDLEFEVDLCEKCLEQAVILYKAKVN